MDPIFVYRNPETAAAENGPLKGLKIALQPNISVAGWPAEAGSNALAGFRALEDATIVRHLRKAGACLCGSTHMSEFGFGLHGSKAGEAVRQKAADAELVLDLMGEARLAALHASACGFKPSWGLVSRLGLVDLIPSMECCAVLSDSLDNISDILKTIAGPDEMDFSLPDEKVPDFSPQKVDPAKTTIGVIAEARDLLAAEQQKDFDASAEGLKKAGFALKELSMPEFSLFSTVHRIVGSVEASSCAGRYDSVRYGRRAPGAKNWNEMYLMSRGAAFGSLLKGYLFQGAFFQFESYGAFEDACRIRARLAAEMQRLTSEADFLALPLADGAPTGGTASLAGTYAQFALTIFASVTGQPVLCLPPQGGALTGLQLSGPRLSDARLLSLGRQLLNTRRGGK